MESVNFVINNATPVRWANLQADLFGDVAHVAPEVLVANVINRLFGAKTDQFETALAHTLSIPFIGGAQPFGEKHAKMESSYTDQVFSGASGVPGLFLGYYLAGVFRGDNILRWTKWGVMDVIRVALSKILTRPIFTSLNKVLAKNNAIRVNYDLMQARFDIQGQQSNLNYE